MTNLPQSLIDNVSRNHRIYLNTIEEHGYYSDVSEYLRKVKYAEKRMREKGYVWSDDTNKFEVSE